MVFSDTQHTAARPYGAAASTRCERYGATALTTAGGQGVDDLAAKPKTIRTLELFWSEAAHEAGAGVAGKRPHLLAAG